MQTARGSFPTTDWGLFVDIREGRPEAKRAALEILARRYWRPAYSFLRQSGRPEEDAKDSTQAFFAEWIENDVFAKADQSRGRFRSFMLSSLKRFVANEHRAGQAQKRRPDGGLFSLDELMDSEIAPFEPAGGMTPDAVFDRTWASEVVQRVITLLEKEYRAKGQEVHLNVFVRRIIAPILHGAEETPLASLGREHGLTEKQAANLLETAKRAFRRLMHDELSLYAESQAEVSVEMREIFRILG